MFIAALSTVARRWSQPRCHQQMMTTWSAYKMWYYLVTKKNEITKFSRSDGLRMYKIKWGKETSMFSLIWLSSIHAYLHTYNCKCGYGITFRKVINVGQRGPWKPPDTIGCCRSYWLFSTTWWWGFYSVRQYLRHQTWRSDAQVEASTLLDIMHNPVMYPSCYWRMAVINII